MAAYKDEERGTWYVSFHYNDWTGKNKKSSNVAFGQERRHWSMSRSFCCIRQQIWI